MATNSIKRTNTSTKCKSVSTFLPSSVIRWLNWIIEQLQEPPTKSPSLSTIGISLYTIPIILIINHITHNSLRPLTSMKQENNSPKGANESSCTHGGDVITAAAAAAVATNTDTKSIFDISNDELMNFLTGNNESLNFLEIKDPNRNSSPGQHAADQLITDRPRRTPRKMQAWVSLPIY